MSARAGIKQPTLGIVGTLVVVVSALTIVSHLDPAFLGSWGAQAVMSVIPAQIVMGMVWHDNYPSFLESLSQPLKGFAAILLLVMVAAVVTPMILLLSNGGLDMPRPFAIMFTIVSVVCTFWAVVVFQCWPAVALAKHPAGIGICVLLTGYLAAWLVFRLGFDFTAMQEAPFYMASLDPHGAFAAWDILSFLVTSVAVIMAFVLLDFWPTGLIVAKVPKLNSQPLLGLLNSILVLGITEGVWFLAVIVLGMSPVDLLVKVAVSALFGEFIVLVMLQATPFQSVSQPLRGGLLLVCVAGLSVITYQLYAVIAVTLVGPMAGLDLSMWIANAMLAITFPMFVLYGGSFGFWPLRR